MTTLDTNLKVARWVLYRILLKEKQNKHVYSSLYARMVFGGQ